MDFRGDELRYPWILLLGLILGNADTFLLRSERRSNVRANVMITSTVSLLSFMRSVKISTRGTMELFTQVWMDPEVVVGCNCK